jgi:hypothetical protein
MRSPAIRVGFLLLAAAGCATSTKATLLEKAYDDAGRRRELFEANLAALDRNPRYVDEFYALAKKHKVVMERFVDAQATDLEDSDEVAAITAQRLRAHPRGLQRTMVHTLDAVERDGGGRRAVAAAMKQRARIAADIILEEEDALAALGHAMAAAAKDDEGKRHNLKEAFKDVVTDKSR